MSSNLLYSKMRCAPDGTFAESSGAHVILLYKKLLRTSDHFGQKITLDPIFEYHINEFGEKIIRLRIRNV